MFVCVAGKNNIAVSVLEYLAQNNRNRYELGIICNCSEQGVDTWQKSLRLYAQKYGVKEYQLDEVYEKKDLVFLSMEFDQLVRPIKFQDARLYNIHFSLLPQYKGMYTAAIPILNGEEYVGVTFHKIDAGIDTGEIIAQIKFKLESDETSRGLYLKYIQYGTRLVLEHLEDVLGNRICSYPQPAEKSSYYSKKYIDYGNLQVDLRQTAEGIKRQIRAFSFREYQMPTVFGRKVIEAYITNIRSCDRPGKILFENSQGMLISTIDYNVCLYFDRFESLMQACAEGDIKIVKEICVVREHINAKNEQGETPLAVATKHNFIDIVDFLILQGADISAQNNAGVSVLEYARDAASMFGDDTLLKRFEKLGLELY